MKSILITILSAVILAALGGFVLVADGCGSVAAASDPQSLGQAAGSTSAVAAVLPSPSN